MQHTLAGESTAPLRFGVDEGFRSALRAQVDQHFANRQQDRRGHWQMYLKAAVMLGGVAGAYTLLVFGTATPWLAVPLVVLLGLALAGVGFNIQHDGGHGAFSRLRWVNRLCAATLDLLGGSSYVWARKHNSIHHSYTNVTGYDDDINVGFMGRLSPYQPRLRLHRFQHWYLWVLYGFLPVKWHFYDDFHNVLTGRIGQQRFPRPRGRELLIFVGGKVLFAALALGVPMLLHPWWIVLACYAAVSFVEGLVLSVVFQLAHCVELAEFPLPRPDTGRMESAWAEHQVQTTVDFAPRNRLLTWFVGGLNFQIEHHLLPQICHVHYPALAPLVQQTCRAFGLRYASQPTLRAGIASHFRWLRRMGRAADTPQPDASRSAGAGALSSKPAAFGPRSCGQLG